MGTRHTFMLSPRSLEKIDSPVAFRETAMVSISAMRGWSKNSCGAAIELEQASESLVTLNGGVATLFGFVASIREKQLVAFTLMVALPFRHNLAQHERR